LSTGKDKCLIFVEKYLGTHLIALLITKLLHFIVRSSDLPLNHVSDANKLRYLGIYRYLYHCENGIDCHLPPKFAAGCKKYLSKFPRMNNVSENWAEGLRLDTMPC
jgi:hypothetical protein